MAEVHLLLRELAAALELYEGLVRDYPDSPKLWNERGVCLHQAGRRAEAVVSYERAVGIDSAYQLAWNNLGVVRAHESSADAAVAAFRQALGADRPLLAARLNLGLLSFQRRQFRAALEEYQQALAEQPASAVAWNGVGLVLMELRRFEDARNAFGRAVDADAGFAAAHYNLSFVLSQLGDFDGALRETRRALELEPLYVPQKFSLTIDLQYEDPTIAIAPELAAETGGEELSGEFEFDAPMLDRLFEELTPSAPQAPPTAPGDALDLARDYIGKGLLDLALAEVSRATARGAPPAAAAVLLGDVFAKRGLYGEALERYREARAAAPDDADATLGEIRALLALGWASDAAPLADDLARRAGGDVEVLVARARVRLAVGDAVGALDCIRDAQGAAPLSRASPASP
jgi:tetratricopeptide (TPR) repeat protein